MNPTHKLSLLDNATRESSTVGWGWLSKAEDGPDYINIRLNPGVTLRYEDIHRGGAGKLTLFSVVGTSKRKKE